MAWVLVVCVFFSACGNGSDTGSGLPGDPFVSGPEAFDPGGPTLEAERTETDTQDSPTRTEAPQAEAEDLSAETDEPSSELIREAVEYVYDINPASFAEGNCFGYGAEADFGAIETVEVTRRQPPRSRTLSLTSGPLTGTVHPLELSISFSGGRIADYPTELFRADPEDGGGWYVDVNMCGWDRFA